MIKFVKSLISSVVALFEGMWTVGKHIFRKPITLEYPEKKPDLSKRFRGRVALRVDEEGKDLCIGCLSCTRVCPCGDLIQIKKEENEIKEFTIDLGRCIVCGNCTEVCPKNAIVMVKDFEYCEYSREALVYDKKRLTLSKEESKKWGEENANG
jgi:NADH-quinone oxidoreductase subunit I